MAHAFLLSVYIVAIVVSIFTRHTTVFFCSWFHSYRCSQSLLFLFEQPCFGKMVVAFPFAPPVLHPATQPINNCKFIPTFRQRRRKRPLSFTIGRTIKTQNTISLEAADSEMEGWANAQPSVDDIVGKDWVDDSPKPQLTEGVEREKRDVKKIPRTMSDGEWYDGDTSFMVKAAKAPEESLFSTAFGSFDVIRDSSSSSGLREWKLTGGLSAVKKKHREDLNKNNKLGERESKKSTRKRRRRRMKKLLRFNLVAKKNAMPLVHAIKEGKDQKRQSHIHLDRNIAEVSSRERGNRGAGDSEETRPIEGRVVECEDEKEARAPLDRTRKRRKPGKNGNFRPHRKIVSAAKNIGRKGAKAAVAAAAAAVPGRRRIGNRLLLRRGGERNNKTQPILVKDLHELRNALLDRGVLLKDIEVDNDWRMNIRDGKRRRNLDIDNARRTNKHCASPPANKTIDHEVLKLISRRAQSRSTPGHRHRSDRATLALCIEGGGMRGAVTAGMAAAVATLGLCDAFDIVYGSSAGSVIGAYVVSRQLCVDVYTDVLPAAKKMFVCRNRMIVGLVRLIMEEIVAKIRILIEEANAAVSRLWRGGGRGRKQGRVAKDRPWPHRRWGRWLWRQLRSLQATPKIGTYLPQSEVLRMYNRTVFDDNSVVDDTSTSISKPGRLQKLPAMLVSRILPIAAAAVSVGANAGEEYFSPGMNISFLLDGVMSPDQGGLRPFDFEAFKGNDARQPLRVVASAVRDGKMETVVFGSGEGDFFEREGDGYEDRRREKNLEASEVGSITNRGRIILWFRRRVRWVRSGLKHLVYGVSGKLFGKVWHRFRVGFSKGCRWRFLSIRWGKNVVLVDDVVDAVNRTVNDSTAGIANLTDILTHCPDEPSKRGLFACLEASMAVPGATGPPIKLSRTIDRVEGREANTTVISCFDAYCYEPLPYRSAVEEGATHALVLRSRPDGCEVETKPCVYDRIIAPLYFRSHGFPSVATYFERGGQLYRYLEDLMTLEEGLVAGCQSAAVKEMETKDDLDVFSKNIEDCMVKVKVPPTTILYGPDYISKNGTRSFAAPCTISEWTRAHLLPVSAPEGTPEVSQLAQDPDEVLSAVREGYAAAFDLLAPAAGIVSDGEAAHTETSSLNGKRVAELIFPKRETPRGEGNSTDRDDDDNSDGDHVLRVPVEVKGTPITPWRRRDEIRRKVLALVERLHRKKAKSAYIRPNTTLAWISDASLPIGMTQDGSSHALLAQLPGLQDGRLGHLVPEGLNTDDQSKT